MGQKAKHALKVRNYHIDAYGHVNSAVYLNFLEEARTTFLEEMGVAIEDLLQQGVYIYLADIAVKFKKPARLGDRLVIWGWYDEVKRVKLRWHQEIINLTTGEQVAVAKTTGAFLKQGKIIPIPPEIRQKLLAFLKKTEG